MLFRKFSHFLVLDLLSGLTGRVLYLLRGIG